MRRLAFLFRPADFFEVIGCVLRWVKNANATSQSQFSALK